jgi:hypothetical protein
MRALSDTNGNAPASIADFFLPPESPSKNITFSDDGVANVRRGRKLLPPAGAQDGVARQQPPKDGDPGVGVPPAEEALEGRVGRRFMGAQTAAVAGRVQDHLLCNVRGVVCVPDGFQCGAQDRRGGLDRRRKDEHGRADAAGAA